MTTMNVKPATADMRILMPESGYLPMPAEGAVVPWDPYYVQLLRHGDLVDLDAEAGEEVEAAPAAIKIEVTPKPVAVSAASKSDATFAPSGSILDETSAEK